MVPHFPVGFQDAATCALHLGGGGALAGLAGLLAALGGGIDKGRRAWGWECARVGRLRFGSGLDQTRRGKQEVVVDVSAGAEKGRGEGGFWRG